MKTIQLSEVGALAEEIRNGETVQIVDGERPVAKVVPEDAEATETLPARPPKAPLPPDFLTRPLPKFEGSVVEQLLEDRRKNDW